MTLHYKSNFILKYLENMKLLSIILLILPSLSTFKAISLELDLKHSLRKTSPMNREE